MPKLSDEFKGQQAAKPTPAPATARPAVKPPQPVTRPAPMAPRAPVQKPAPAPTPVANGQPRPQSQPSGNDALAEKLRAQRAAAEKLAEQRVLAARERAEGRAPAESSLAPSRPRQTEQPSTSAPRPKFSFADDSAPVSEPALTPRQGAGPLLPPRPALGGERTQPPFLRPGAGATQPGYRPEPPPYRPIDPATGYPGASSRTQPPLRPYGNEPGGYAPSRLPQPRRPAYDPYARGPEPGFESEAYPDDQPRLGRPPAPRGRPRQYEPEPEDVFEDEQAPRRRASARDYQTAYRDNEEGYEEDRRRSSGPWLLLLALLVAALVTGGIVWYYNTKMKTATVPAQGDSVPVISAPEQAAKTAPETPVDAGGEAPAVKKKQIYDRIVGEQEVSGDQLAPTEEIPVQPEAVPAAAEPAGENTGQIPEPTGGLPEALEEPAPLPLPPPPGNDTQGSLDQSGAAKMATAAAQDPPEMPAPAAVAEGAANNEQASPPSIVEPAQEEPEVPAAKPAKPKTATAAAKKKAVAAAPDPAEDLGAEPVVLVPPSQDAVNPIQGGKTTSAGISQPAPAPAPAKKKTLLDLFKSSDSTTTQTAEPTQQVAAVQPTQPAAPQPSSTKKATAPAAPSGSGYFIQLASFRTQSEAQSEYNRLQSSYSNIIGGLPSSITQATVAGSTRYRVGVGPLSSREQATKVCNSLFSAGERDCLVRAQ
jgi:cell division septation protein DedD